MAPTRRLTFFSGSHMRIDCRPALYAAVGVTLLRAGRRIGRTVELHDGEDAALGIAHHREASHFAGGRGRHEDGAAQFRGLGRHRVHILDHEVGRPIGRNLAP